MDTTLIVDKLGFKHLNKMQYEALQQIQPNTTTLLLSPTGTGKTVAFLLPVLAQLSTEKKGVQGLIIVPSRELVLQIEQVWKKMGTSFKVSSCYGGHAITTEINNLKEPPALLIGTPGRLVDHIERNSFNPKTIEILVLDEFDKSLQLGFHDEMLAIRQELHHLKTKILVSATSDIAIPSFMNAKDPCVLDYVKDNKPKKLLIDYYQVDSPHKDKIETLYKLLCSFGSQQAIVFFNHREVLERVYDEYTERGLYANFYHGGMDQEERERALIQFKNGSVQFLLATDLAARGLDIPQIKHIVHYHLPLKADEFTHRNGRTARNNEAGNVYIITHESDANLTYVPEDLPKYKLAQSYKIPLEPLFKTLYISGGKKNKLNKTDIVGFLSKKGKLERQELGLVEVKDFISFAAVSSSKIHKVLALIKDEKMKGKKYKIAIARDIIKKEEE